MVKSNIKVMLRMLKLVRPLTLYMCIAILTGVLGFICAIGIPVLSAMAVLQISGMYPHLPIHYILPILIILAILRGILHYLEQATNHYIAFKILAIIRDYVYTALRRLAPAKLDGKDKGNLISLITNDVELLEVFYAHTISPVFIAIFVSAVMLKFFTHMHIIAAILAFLSYVVMSFVIPVIVDRMGNSIGMEHRNKIGELSSFILETFRGMSTLQQFNMYKQRKMKMLEKNDEIESIQGKMKSIQTLQIVVSQLFISISSIIMFLVMYNLYLNYKVSLYDVMMCTVLQLSSFGPVIALSSLSHNLLSTLNSGRRVLALLDEEEVVKEVDGCENSCFGDIAGEDIVFGYDDDVILDHVCIDIEKNKITGIVGKSGSGKSTLLKLIMRFYDRDRGSLSINKKDVMNINTKDMRSMFAYVTQETVLFHDSIYNNIIIANLSASKEDVISACKKANIHDFIASLPNGYDTSIAELGASLSGGERQRIGLARAFLSNADCILLDEPTSNLDILNEAVILKSLKNFHQSIVLVSHRESTMKIADKVYHMNYERVS